MSKATITLYNRQYTVNCDPGEEVRLGEIVDLVEGKMHDVAGKIGNTTEARMLMLTCLTLADELLELKKTGEQLRAEDEDLFVAAVEHLRGRVASIASQVGQA